MSLEPLLRETIQALRESAAAQAESARASDNIAKAIVVLRDENIAGRDKAVLEVKRHITADVDAREKWWRMAFKVGIVVLTIATLMNVPLGRLVEMVAGIAK